MKINMTSADRFKFDMANKAEKALKQIEESTRYSQPVVGADRYNELLLESKLEKDAKFLMTFSSLLNESQMPEFMGNLQILLEATKDIFREVDMKPRTCSRAIDTQELTESAIINLYNKYLTENINKNYSLPLFEGTLLETHKKESRLLMESALASNLTASIDNELFLKYSLFENAMVNNCIKIILPDTLEERADLYIKNQTPEYFDIFSRNAKTLKNEILETTINIVSMIAPKLFEESAGLKNSGVQSFAGISRALINT